MEFVHVQQVHARHTSVKLVVSKKTYTEKKEDIFITSFLNIIITYCAQQLANITILLVRLLQ